MCRYIFAGFLALFYSSQFIDARPQFQTVEMPTACGSKRYCTEKGPDYPEHAIETLLVGFDKMWQEVVNQTIPSNRWGFQNNECKSASVTEPIYVMIDEHDNLRYVVQNEKRFNQIVFMEECVNPGLIKSATQVLSQDDVNTHEFVCQQKTINFNFLVLSLDGTKLETAKMKNNVPVCCTCVLAKLKTE